MVTALRSKWAAGKAVRTGLAEGGRALKNSQPIRRLPDDVIIIC
jgi:hypothetical protein